MEGKASGNQGVILLNKRLNLPSTGALSPPFMLQNTRTTRLGYMLLVFSPSQCIDNKAMGDQNIRWSHSNKWAGRSINPGQHCTWPTRAFPRSPCVTGAVNTIQGNWNSRNTCRGLCHELQQVSVLGRSGRARPELSGLMSIGSLLQWVLASLDFLWLLFDLDLVY